MAHGWGVLTVALLVKDKPRRTTLGRKDVKKIQARMYTSHAMPLIQAILNVENKDNVIQVFGTLQQQLRDVVPDKPPVEGCVEQLHKDYLACLEVARLHSFKRSRPVNDYFHLMQKKKAMESKLQKTNTSGGKFHKAEYHWVIFSLDTLRHLPTLDLFSALWGGWLRRLQVKQEPLLENYLGPTGKAKYTLDVSNVDIQRLYGIVPLNPDLTARMLFSPIGQVCKA